METFIIKCPHCKKYIFIEKINCAIFRHAVYKSNNEQVNPHLNKIECQKLIENNLVYGCCLPFKIIEENNKFIAIICDYI